MTVGDVLVCMILGAAVLAIAQLWAAHRRHERTIRELHAELTAQRIAALTGSGPLQPPNAAEEPPEPARRKRHLALYVGGGAVAAMASLGGKLRPLLRGHTAAVAASTTVIVGTAAAATLYLASGSDTAREASDDRPPRPSLSPGESADNDATDAESKPVVLPLDATTTLPINKPGGSGPIPGEATESEADPDQTQAGETPTPSPPDGTAATQAPPKNKSTPPPAIRPPEPMASPSTGTVEPAPDDGGCIRLPPLLAPCLF